jgi:hypothetical protein
VLLYPGLPSFSFFLPKDKRKAAMANIEASGSEREAARLRNQLQGQKGKQIQGQKGKQLQGQKGKQLQGWKREATMV